MLSLFISSFSFFSALGNAGLFAVVAAVAACL